MRPIDDEVGRMRGLTWLALVIVVITIGACSGSATTPGATQPRATPGATQSGPAPVIRGTVTAGPVCPVESNPPDPACAPRPVAGAVIVAINDEGDEVGRTVTGDDGTYELPVGQTGTLTITGEPVEGLMGAPKPQQVTLTGDIRTVTLDLVYDTGIR
jgi:hypothetical protein